MTAHAVPIGNGTRAILHGVAVTYLRSSDGATAIVADHGAHVLSWCPADATEALYLSPTSRYGQQHAIRGGVPVIFPQFGEQGPGRRHGVARVQPWTLLSTTMEAEAAVACWALQGRHETGTTHGSAGAVGSVAGDDFRLVLEVRLQGDALQLGLTIENIGALPWSCQAALHTYLRVDDLALAAVDGLQGCRNADQVASGAVSVQKEASLRFAREIDRIYPDSPAVLQLRDGTRRVTLEQHGFLDTVVWNPGASKAAALSDLPAPGYREFVCIEAGVIDKRLTLDPGAVWHARQHLRVVLD